MPTYQEAIKKLKSRPRFQKTRGFSAFQHTPKTSKKKPKKVVKRIKPKKKILKPKKKIKKILKLKKIVRKLKPKKRAIKKKKIKKVKPQKKAMKKAIKRKLIKKAKPKKTIKRKPEKKFRKKVITKKAIRRKKKPARRARKLIKPRVYIGKGILDQLFESQAKVKLLKFFFRNAEKLFQSKDIFKQLRSNIILLHQEMKKLEKIGLIKQRKTWLGFEKKRGGVRKEKRTVWHLNPNFNFLNELRNLVLRSTVASKEDLIENAKKLGNIKLLVLSGIFVGDSVARADMLIVGDKINQRKLNTFIKDLEAEIGKELRCAVMTTKEFKYRYDMYDRFVRDLLTDNCEILIKKVELW